MASDSIKNRVSGILEVSPTEPDYRGYGGRRAVNASSYMKEVRKTSEESDSFAALYNEAQAISDRGSAPRQQNLSSRTAKPGKARKAARGAKHTVGKAVPVLQDDEPVLPQAVIQQKPEPTVVRTRVTIPGFGVVPTEFLSLDVGATCVHVAMSEYSWTPPQAGEDDAGNLTGGFQMEDIPGKTLYHLGLEWEDSEGIRHMVLCVNPDASQE